MEKFHHYEVLKREDGSFWELGRGAMGITYKAFDTNLRIPVALKVINSQKPGLDNETAKLRFVREARAAAALRHPNVASVYHLGNDDQSFFYAMEFIDGETPEALVQRQGPLPWRAALRIALQVTLALGAAARQNLIHRDIKPANLMLVRAEGEESGGGADEPPLVKVIDFGLAKSTEGLPPDAQTLGQLGSQPGFIGTAAFASPEQLENRAVDTRSDIYSLGATLWYLLAGKPPFSGAFFAVLAQHLTRPPPLEELPAATPAPVRALLARMLDKDPAGRPPTPAALKREIESCLQADCAPGGGVSSANPAETEAPSLPHRLVPGILLKGRYRLEALVAETGEERTFRARDQAQGGRAVLLQVLPPGRAANPHERQQLARWVERLRAAPPHPNFLETLAFESEGALAFLVREAVCGWSLFDLLRRRGALTPSEALRVARSVAAAIEHARAHEIRWLALDPARIGLHFAGATEEIASAAGGLHRQLLDQPMEKWPPFTVKIPVLDRPPASSDASRPATAELTILPGRGERVYDTRQPLARDADTAGSPGAPNALALSIYEWLGGSPSLGKAGARYVPLPSLREDGNQALRQWLSGEAAGWPAEGQGESAAVARLAAAVGVEFPGDESSQSRTRLAALAIPEKLLRTAQRGTLLRLVPEPATATAEKGSDPSAALLPWHLVARARFRLGRTREEVDLVTWFWPRGEANDARTRRVGRAALRLEARGGELLAHNPAALNSLLLNGQPVSADAPRRLPLGRASEALLGGEYRLELLPCEGPAGRSPPGIGNFALWAGAAEAAGGETSTVIPAGAPGFPGAVRLRPLGSAPAFYQAVWMLSQAAFGRGETEALPLGDSALARRQGCFYHHAGGFWVENFLINEAVRLNDAPLLPGEISPLASGQILRLGRGAYRVEVGG